MNLGTCCVCGTKKNVNTVIQLHFKAPIPGRGWGCLVCNLPADGAVAVVCGKCASKLEGYKTDPIQGLRWACKGYPAEDGRVPIVEVLSTAPHDHDMTKHQEGD